MFSELVKRTRYIFLLLALSSFSAPGFAETGHCNYRLYSKATDRTHKVCQTAHSRAECGRLLRRGYDRSRAHAVGRKGRRIKFVKGDCSPEAVVGICTLPHSEIFFYEGDAEELATGCEMMRGRWEVNRL